ncbi:pogo transposable element, putative [Pseudozyma hubeiensis SY62]|uniref:Pogo transposable element, putative n=1 Tax=Pseudozyma hubeiensis (strain SY62) TaxID=1305764 RepID=R9PN27_PSEHS|nr:pogo transposable element, putative [Pseudozyma hubeiensis SY62]GAC99530.1 pogo transposable element, putative [Pseudozyma hubeiensis SY62]
MFALDTARVRRRRWSCSCRTLANRRSRHLDKASSISTMFQQRHEDARVHQQPDKPVRPNSTMYVVPLLVQHQARHHRVWIEVDQTRSARGCKAKRFQSIIRSPVSFQQNIVRRIVFASCSSTGRCRCVGQNLQLSFLDRIVDRCTRSALTRLLTAESWYLAEVYNVNADQGAVETLPSVGREISGGTLAARRGYVNTKILANERQKWYDIVKVSLQNRASYIALRGSMRQHLSSP